MVNNTPAAIFVEGEVIEIDLRDIDIGDRIGFYWPEKAQALAAIIAKDGQHTPISVARNRSNGKRWALIAGLHRVMACQMAGLDSVVAIPVQADARERRRIEASENLHRRDFGPIEKALFIRAICDVYEEEFAEGHEGKSAHQIGQIKRWEASLSKVQISDATKAEGEAELSSATIAELYGWQDKAADAAGMSARSLRDYLLIHRTIVAPFPDLFEPLARHPLGQQRKAVMEIAGITGEAGRGRVIETLLAEEAIGSVGEAKVKAGLAAASSAPAQGQSKFMSGASANLDRLSPAGWRDFAPRLAAAIKPSALKDVRDAIDARLAEMEGDNG